MVTLEQTVEKKVAKALALTRVQAKEEKDWVVDAAAAEYKASEAFQVVKVGCFLDIFEDFRK